MAAQLYLFRFIYFQDTIYPSSGSHDLASDFPLVDVDHFSRKSALSGMLLKQWNKDKDISSELKQWVRTRNRDSVWLGPSDIQKFPTLFTFCSKKDVVY